MKWIKRLCSFILLCLLIAGGILLFRGYREYREALSGKSVEEMARQIESIDNYTSLDESYGKRGTGVSASAAGA